MKQEKEYIMLWIIVVFIGICMFIFFAIYKGGQGRWECDEYKFIGEDCVYEQSSRFAGGISPYPMCKEIKKECVKEVWTKQK